VAAGVECRGEMGGRWVGGSEGLCCLCGEEKRVRGWKMIDGGGGFFWLVLRTFRGIVSVTKT